MVTVAAGHSNDLLAGGTPQNVAMVEGFRAAFRVQAIVLAGAGLVRCSSTRRRARSRSPR
jgi:hypothetical protein